MDKSVHFLSFFIAHQPNYALIQFKQYLHMTWDQSCIRCDMFASLSICSGSSSEASCPVWSIQSTTLESSDTPDIEQSAVTSFPLSSLPADCHSFSIKSPLRYKYSSPSVDFYTLHSLQSLTCICFSLPLSLRCYFHPLIVNGCNECSFQLSESRQYVRCDVSTCCIAGKRRGEEEEEEDGGYGEFISPIPLLVSLSQLLHDLRFSPRRATRVSPRRTGTWAGAAKSPVRLLVRSRQDRRSGRTSTP